MTFKTIILSILLLFLSLDNVAQNDLPNIILITLDDMNWDSPNSFGSQVDDLTPHIDQLANMGMKFEKAYVQAPNCSPSRIAIQTGLYPHQSGARGFYYVKPNGESLPEILQNNNYFTGVLNKVADTSPSPYFDIYWDAQIGISGKEKRSSEAYGRLMNRFFKKVDRQDKPFYCVVNIADPHKPFFNDPAAKKKTKVQFAPSKIYNKDDVEIPGYLPQHPVIKEQVVKYFNSVKRGDDCVGEILNSLKASSYQKNTVIILLSDHGAPFPFAKSSVYQNGVKTPLIVAWPDKIQPKSVNQQAMVSAVDLMPTILDMAQIEIPRSGVGRSFYNALLAGKNPSTEFVFSQFDENAGGIPRPSRTVIAKRYGYIFNPWATGQTKFVSAASYHRTFKTMRKVAKERPDINKRLQHWLYRSVEELYDYEKDPHALHNLIDDPDYAEIAEQLREKLQQQMTLTKDYVLEAFLNKNDKAYLNAWMERELAAAEQRRKTIQWKRYKNRSGKTNKNKLLYSPLTTTEN